jgi:membrane associated rhomboid family serine protease
MGMIQDFKAWSRREGTALTIGLLVTLSLTNLYFMVNRFVGIEWVAYPGSGFQKPWRLLTYPWAFIGDSGSSLIWFVFLMLWLYMIGSSVEKDIGTARMAILWFVATLLGALCNALGVTITKGFSPMIGPMLPIAALSVLWCTRNPTATIRIYMIIPIMAKWLGWFIVAGTVISYGSSKPLVGVLDCVPLLVAYLFASNRIPGLSYGPSQVFQATQKQATTRGQVMYDQSYFDEVKRRETEREEQARLKKLLGED